MSDRSEITLTLKAPEGYDAALFVMMLQVGASDVVDRAAMEVFERQEAGGDTEFVRRHYEACKLYAEEVSRVAKEAMKR